MNDEAIKDEILSRMNPQTYSMSSRDLIDLTNEFGIDEQDIAWLYSQVVEEQRKELQDTVKDVVDDFRKMDRHFISFEHFKKEFDKYDVQTFISDDILRDMYKKETEDKDQMSLFEIQKMIQQELYSIREEDNFERDAERIKKGWGGEIEKAPDAELTQADIFDIADAGVAAKADIEAAYGEDEFSPMSDDEYKNIMRDLNEDGEEVITPKSLLRPQDSNGNDIKLKARVKNIDGSAKSGMVTGFGDDGQGRIIAIVDYMWPVDMKFMQPKEMGKIEEYPENLIVQNIKTNEMNEELNKEINEETIIEVVNEIEVNEEICDTDASEGSAEETLDETRGVSHISKNTGDRNVKQDKEDHSMAPVTALNESIDKLFEGRVTKGTLLNFIKEEAKKIAKDSE